MALLETSGAEIAAPPTDEVVEHLLGAFVNRSSSVARPQVDLELIVPAYNEEARLPNTLCRTIEFLSDRAWSCAIVVVDNGSIDRTVDVVDRFASSDVPVHVIGCSRRGKGAAVRRGIRTSTSRFVGFMDADLATSISALDRVMPLLESGVGAVVGSRHLEESSTFQNRRLARSAGSVAYRALARSVVPNVHDTQCGFKFFDGRLARAVAERCQVNGFAFDLEFLVLLERLGGDVVEIPVEWEPVDGSTFRTVRDGFQSMSDIRKLRKQYERV